MRKISGHLPLYLTWILLIGAIVLSVFERQWHTLLMASITFTATLLPIIFQKKYNIYIPPIFVSFIAFFAYATLFLGEVSGFYYKFWWWDLVLHLGSAIGFGLLGVVVLLLIFGKRRNESHPLLFSMLAFCFAVTVGVLWEIFEFCMDQFFGFNMQKSGLLDTMTDLIIDCIGAGIAGLAGYLYVTEAGPNPLHGLIDRGYLANKSLLKKSAKNTHDTEGETEASENNNSL